MNYSSFSTNLITTLNLLVPRLHLLAPVCHRTPAATAPMAGCSFWRGCGGGRRRRPRRNDSAGGEVEEVGDGTHGLMLLLAVRWAMEGWESAGGWS